MKAAVLLTALAVVGGCRFTGAESHVGFGAHDLAFGEVGAIFEGENGSRVKAVPFLLAGEGRLPSEFGPERESFSRISVGDKARLPFPLNDRFVLYLEGGAMVSYYEADAIGTPFELEVIAGVGAQVELGDGWNLDFAARARHPTGNGNNHDTPEHAPDDTQGEFVFGIKKDF